MSEMPILKLNKDELKNVKEKRSVWAVKKYLHRWGNYNGEEVFIKFRGKHNRTYKEVAFHQYIVDELKVLFELNKMGTKIVYDDIEGYGIMQKWWKNLGTIKDRNVMPIWICDKNLIEMMKICIFDGLIGGLDRHGNNVLVLEDNSLLTIDDEDVFYDKLRVWIKFDKDIKRTVYLHWLARREFFAGYIERLKQNTKKMLEFADCEVMRGNEQYKFYEIFENNLSRIDEIYKETVRQLLL